MLASTSIILGMVDMRSTTERTVEAGLSQLRKVPDIFKFIALLLAWYILLWTIIFPCCREMGAITRTLIGASMMLIGFLIDKIAPAKPKSTLRSAFDLSSIALIFLGIIIIDTAIQDISGISKSPVYFDP